MFFDINKGEITMRKVYIAVVMLAVLLVGQISVFASPDTIAPEQTGNSTELVAITKPKNQKDSTFDSSYIVSGYGKEGTTVGIYLYSSEEGVYKKLFNEAQYVDGEGVVQKTKVPAETVIGASGLFLNSIPLTQGVNDVLVYAENGEQVQFVKLAITKYNYNLFDIIKSLTN